ncbi:MAG: hypothetical protein MRZ46_05140 [Oscillospiraceae bacterium]|nr:hypothetical protein [Oscillospiraceae bacterium]MDY3256702.1 hypothetical protein [Ruminococcus callidus]
MNKIECGRKLNLDFKNGTVLRAETLNNQNFYSEKIRQYAYSDYPDGIVSGFSLKKNGDFWYLTPGIAKMNDNIYVLDQVSDEEILSLGEKNDCEYWLCLRKKNLSVDNISKEHSENSNEQKPESYEILELCSVKKNEWSDEYILVAKYTKIAGKIRVASSMKEFKESSNRFSTLDGNYSISGEVATSSDFTDLVKNILKDKKDKDYLDVNLYMSCVNQRCIARENLLFYCSCKLQREIEWSEIIEALFEAVEINIAPHYQENIDKVPVKSEKSEFNYNA